MAQQEAEKRKPSRRRKKKRDESRVVKLSAEVYEYITRKKSKVSVDHSLRLLLDLPFRKGKKGAKARAKHYWALLGEHLWLGRTQREAKGEAILRQVQTGEEQPSPVKLREVK